MGLPVCQLASLLAKVGLQPAEIRSEACRAA
jgi:hypothetical protein